MEASQKNGQPHGLTLIEIMGIISLLGLIALGIGMWALNNPQLEDPKTDTTRAILQVVGTGLHAFYEKHHRYPDESESITVLVREGILEKEPKDGFGHEFKYELVDGFPKVTSYGQDGVPGGERNYGDLVLTIDANGHETLH